MAKPNELQEHLVVLFKRVNQGQLIFLLPLLLADLLNIRNMLF